MLRIILRICKIPPLDLILGPVLGRTVTVFGHSLPFLHISLRLPSGIRKVLPNLFLELVFKLIGILLGIQVRVFLLHRFGAAGQVDVFVSVIIALVCHDCEGVEILWK
jgi:hypothetical protein